MLRSRYRSCALANGRFFRAIDSQEGGEGNSARIIGSARAFNVGPFLPRILFRVLEFSERGVLLGVFQRSDAPVSNRRFKSADPRGTFGVRAFPARFPPEHPLCDLIRAVANECDREDRECKPKGATYAFGALLDIAAIAGGVVDIHNFGVALLRAIGQSRVNDHVETSASRESRGCGRR